MELDLVEMALERLEAAVAKVSTAGNRPSAIGIQEPWSLPSDTLRLLNELAAAKETRHIVEFGSGASTVMFADACRRATHQCKVTSIEHDPDFRNQTMLRLEKEQLHTFATVRFAPLVLKKYGYRLLPGYHLGDHPTVRDTTADLILIDGPPQLLGGREGMLYQAMDFARPGTIVVLDDADRPDERASLTAWEHDLGESITIVRLGILIRPVAVIVIRSPVRTEELWDYQMRVALSEIASVVPESAQLLLADENAWNAGGHINGRKRYYFTEADSAYNGPPADVSSAIANIDDHRARVTQFLAVGWPAFWWLDHYAGMTEHLSACATPVFNSSRVLIFRLHN